MSHSPRQIIIAVVVILGIIGVGYYFQWSIITNYWWVLIFLLCPLMHIGGHGGHGGKNEEGRDHHEHGSSEKN